MAKTYMRIDVDITKADIEALTYNHLTPFAFNRMLQSRFEDAVARKRVDIDKAILRCTKKQAEFANEKD